ncbi:MAG: 50S ribosomal protein L3 [Nanoarchaeota archaeon]|nr:50S ribosomal protein L3 [Nanoarchaeota archaeon]
MAKKSAPRKGSLQFHPRSRAQSPVARVRRWLPQKEAKLLGFAGYKVGMAHVIATDNNPNSLSKNNSIRIPVTIIECPPLKAVSARFYNTVNHYNNVVGEVYATSFDKDLARKRTMPKKPKTKIEDIKEYDHINLLVQTLPALTTIGKKKPELFEVGIGGNKEEQLAYAKEMLGKEINVADIIQPGSQVDIHAVTKGQGVQGPVRRFGVTLKSHKSEKGRRRPGSLGAWKAQVNHMWKIAFSGQTGFFRRTEYNKWVVQVSTKPEKNPKDGFIRYGLIKNPYILLKGSTGGARKRLVRISHACRPRSNIPKKAPEITFNSRLP